MLPSEKAERWLWRAGLALLVFCILYITVWLVGFIGRTLHRVREQHKPLPDTVAPLPDNE
jgi:hypothetical protein